MTVAEFINKDEEDDRMESERTLPPKCISHIDSSIRMLSSEQREVEKPQAVKASQPLHGEMQ